MENEKDKSLAVIWIIWAAMLISLAIYVMICHQMGDEMRSDIDLLPTSQISLLRYILAAVSVIELAVAWFIRRFVLKRITAGTFLKKYAFIVMICLAVSESIGIFGMALYFVGDSISNFYAFISISALTMIFFRPRQDEFEQLCS